jgi:hypothetical protein
VAVIATKINVNQGIVHLLVKGDPLVNIATAVLIEILLSRTEELNIDAKVDNIALSSKYRDISQG